MSKPFRESKLGKFLGSKGLDAVLGVAGAIYPPLSAVDAIKDMVMGDKLPVPLTDEAKKEFAAAYQDYLTEMDMQLKDVANAREMYSKKSEMADRVALLIMRWNLPIILVLIASIVMAALMLEGTIMALVTNTITAVVTYLLSERQQVGNFFLGSSAGSKANAEAIRQKLNNDGT